MTRIDVPLPVADAAGEIMAHATKLNALLGRWTTPDTLGRSIGHADAVRRAATKLTDALIEMQEADNRRDAA